MAKRKKSARMTQAEQSARFIETAKGAEASDNIDEFEKAFMDVASQDHPTKKDLTKGGRKAS